MLCYLMLCSKWIHNNLLSHCLVLYNWTYLHLNRGHHATFLHLWRNSCRRHQFTSIYGCIWTWEIPPDGNVNRYQKKHAFWLVRFWPLINWHGRLPLTDFQWFHRDPNSPTRSYPLVNVYTTMGNHHFQWENQLCLWPFSIAMLVYWRVVDTESPAFEGHFRHFPAIHGLTILWLDQFHHVSPIPWDSLMSTVQPAN